MPVRLQQSQPASQPTARTEAVKPQLKALGQWAQLVP